MKKPIFFLLLLCLSGCCLILVSCHKDKSSLTTTGSIPPPNTKIDSSTFAHADSLIGKWSIVEDTLAVANSYYFSNGGDTYYPSADNYIGGANDYLTFNNDGTYTGSEQGVFAGGTYQLLAGRGLSISSRPPLAAAEIVILTADSLVIAGKASSSNGGTAMETLYLRR